MRRVRPERIMLALTLFFVVLVFKYFVAVHLAGRGAAIVETEHGTAAEAAEKLDVNTATEEELRTLPGIGEKRAAAIVCYREEHGPFASLEALGDVPGIGAATIADLMWYAQVKG